MARHQIRICNFFGSLLLGALEASAGLRRRTA
jgi:hypothetical protein